MGNEKIWFCADHHFRHKKMSEIRGVGSVDEMDRKIIDNHNSVVGKRDHVYLLGDFCLGSALEANSIIRKLNGNKFFINGNHDKQRYNGFAWMKDLYDFRHDGTLYILCHYPIESWKNKHYGSVHLHGHSHGNSMVMENRYDVGIDNNGLRPFSIDELKPYELWAKPIM